MPSNLQSRLQQSLGGAYTLERELTGGGMSRVFVAEERALGRTVVVKVLPPDLAAGVNRDRFRREIQLAARLQHPHIVPLLSAGEANGSLWYTMPFIEGESLRERMRLLDKLPKELSHDQLAWLDGHLGLSTSGNNEILFAWLELALANRYDPAVPSIEGLVTSVGRGLLIYPVYKDLMAEGDWGKPIAARLYEKAKGSYHPVVAAGIGRIVNPRN